MIDLKSTTGGLNRDEAASAHLLAAVIAQAIKDASSKPGKKEVLARRNLSTDAKEAIEFLFGENPTFPEYADLIGLEAESIRRALTRDRPTDELVQHQFTDFDRRTLKLRLRWAGL